MGIAASHANDLRSARGGGASETGSGTVRTGELMTVEAVDVWAAEQ
jgi:hypothetical protein